MLANSWNGRLACLCIVLIPLGRPADAKPVLTFLPINTTATAVNDSGVVVGREKAGVAFVRTPDGRMTTFKIIAAGTEQAKVPATWPAAINSSGVIAGQFWDDNNVAHGFVRAADGTITTFDAPNASQVWGFGTFPYSVSTEGVITGYYNDYQHSLAHGFVRAVDGTFTSFDVPKAVQTYAMAANDKGEVTGIWLGASCECAFVRSPGGEITSFNVPDGTATLPTAIDSKGTITGVYDYGLGSFVRRRNGEFTTFDAPIIATAISAGAVTGYGHAGHNARPGFVRYRNGRVRAITAPETAFYPLGINTQGVVVGYLTQRHKQYGFIWTP